MHFAISLLLFVAGWLHGQTGRTYAVTCPPPHEVCAVVDMHGPRVADATFNHYKPLVSAAVTLDELQSRVYWGSVNAAAEYWFVPANEGGRD